MQHVYIGADHGGFDLKAYLVKALQSRGYTVEDLGTSGNESCDYPDFIFPVAEKVSCHSQSVGIVICKSGIGASICANKVRGIRAALCRTKDQALFSRKHNYANVLALGSNDVTPEAALEIFEAWVKEPFEGGRHERRIQKIKDYEASF